MLSPKAPSTINQTYVFIPRDPEYFLFVLLLQTGLFSFILWGYECYEQGSFQALRYYPNCCKRLQRLAFSQNSQSDFLTFQRLPFNQMFGLVHCKTFLELCQMMKTQGVGNKVSGFNHHKRSNNLKPDYLYWKILHPLCQEKIFKLVFFFFFFGIICFGWVREDGVLHALNRMLNWNSVVDPTIFSVAFLLFKAFFHLCKCRLIWRKTSCIRGRLQTWAKKKDGRPYTKSIIINKYFS